MNDDSGCDTGSWKCGKGKAFTHIPTNFMVLIKTNPSINYKKNRGEKV